MSGASMRKLSGSGWLIEFAAHDIVDALDAVTRYVRDELGHRTLLSIDYYQTEAADPVHVIDHIFYLLVEAEVDDEWQDGEERTQDDQLTAIEKMLEAHTAEHAADVEKVAELVLAKLREQNKPRFDIPRDWASNVELARKQQRWGVSVNSPGFVPNDGGWPKGSWEEYWSQVPAQRAGGVSEGAYAPKHAAP